MVTKSTKMVESSDKSLWMVENVEKWQQNFNGIKR